MLKNLITKFFYIYSNFKLSENLHFDKNKKNSLVKYIIASKEIKIT